MAEATPTTSLSVVCGGGLPLLPSPSPSLPLTHLQLRNQFIASPRGPSVGNALLSNGHMISALAFARDVYMNVSIPLNVDVTCQPSFLPWGRLALLLFILNRKSKPSNEGKGEMKIEEEDMKQSGLNGGQEDCNSCTLTPQVICTCFYGNEDDEDDDAASWNDLHGFCLKCECFYGVRAKYECNLKNEEDSEDEFDDDNHKQEDDDDGNEDDEDFIVQFTCVSSSLSPIPTPHSGTNLLNPHSGTTFLLLPPRPPPHLQHVSSFSSDESGFCERLPFDWSNSSSNDEEEEDEDDEEEDEDDEEGDCTPCVFDEGLWHEFEEQACFNNNINSLFCPLSSSSSSSDSGSEVTIMEEIDPLPPSLHHLAESQTKDDSPPLPPQHSQSSTYCKRVSFKPEPHLASVHYMVTWRYAYRMARKGHWEQLGLDRDRFQKRIETVDKAIGPCLLKKLEKMKQETAAAPLQ